MDESTWFLLSYCHVGVYIILKEIVPIDERYFPTLRGLWQAINPLFKKNPLVFHVFLVPTVKWMIF
jgi:hypothetical protein